MTQTSQPSFDTQLVHQSVLLEQAIEALNIKSDGIYLDATFGRGGHSLAILNQLGPNGRLIAFDLDPWAIEFAQTHFRKEIESSKLLLVNRNFSDIASVLTSLDIHNVDGILADLGISSPQLDEGQRGFSFRYDAALDMRMNPNEGEPISVWLNRASHGEMARVFREYGEESMASAIANQIITTRALSPILTTFELAQCVEQGKGKASRQGSNKHKSIHPATKVFQALRILINRELDSLAIFLKDAPDYVSINGRFVIISFHSLEDRIVKHRFNELSGKQGHQWQKTSHLHVSLDHQAIPQWRILDKIRAEADALVNNPRARSAILRVVERIQIN